MRRGSVNEVRRSSLTNVRRTSLPINFGLKFNGKTFGEDKTKMWSNTIGKSVGLLPGRAYAGPLMLITLAPMFVMLLYHTLVNLDGSVAKLIFEMRKYGVVRTVYSAWPSIRNPFVWKIIAVFMGFELILMRLVPGKEFRGPVSPAGHVPIYKANGMQCFAITLIFFALGAKLGFYNGGIVYDYMGNILASMNFFALVFCAFLYLKGKYFPSSNDTGSSGNAVFDFYWGMELYPRILGWDVKHFTNCRCGMQFWAVFCISALYKQKELYGEVSTGLWVNVIIQLVYITKFYWWETGYLCTMDIMHDRAGFYICWGVLVWLPCIYTSHTMYLVAHPAHIFWPLALGILAAGLLFVYINFDADRQRQKFRACGGRMKIWGGDPFFIEAKYTTEKGEAKSSLLLGSGYWGISRHFHYIPEILAATCWTCCVWTPMTLPYFYVPYLTLLLLDRAFRDDARCKSKYKNDWAKYCKKVQWLLIPYIV